MEMPGKLSLEQEFKLNVIKSQVGGLSLDQAQEYVVEVMRQMMIKDNLVKHLLKGNLQISPSAEIDSILNGGCNGIA
jgi:hypothetical protein